MLSVLLLCWVTLRLHGPSTCYPLQQAPSPPDAMAGDPEDQRQAETETATDRYLMRRNVRERVRRTITQGSEGVFAHLKNPTKGCFSVLDVKSNTFLCLDSKRKLHTSVDGTNEDCRFLHVQKHKTYDFFRSCKGDVLVILHQKKASTAPHNARGLSGPLWLKQLKKNTNRRKRRSWHFDPSDPLGSEYPNFKAVNSQRKDPEYSSNIFKETIALVDDPLQVLLPHSPLSPTLEKNWKNKKFRF